MEEDIKLLEELIEHNYLEDIFYLRENNHHIKFNKAIENLINKYKKLKTFKQDVIETVNEYSNNEPEHHIFDIDDCINITTDILLLLGIGGKRDVLEELLKEACELWQYDITFCNQKECHKKDCKRHPSRIPKGIPVSVCVDNKCLRIYLRRLL